MIIDKANWDTFFDGFMLVDGVLSNATRMWFLARSYQGGYTRFISVDTKRPMAERCNYTQFSDFSKYKSCIGLRNDGVREMLGVDLYGRVFGYNTQQQCAETGINMSVPGTEYCWGVSRLVSLPSGLYALGSGRTIVRRLGIAQWSEAADIPLPDSWLTESSSSFNDGFSDMSEFNQQDVYAVGGIADLWHFDGESWQQLEFPAKEYLISVCCAGDGLVYIGTQSGALWCGRGNDWRCLIESSNPYIMQNLHWFADQLWCAGGNGLAVVKAAQLTTPAQLEDPKFDLTRGSLSLSADGLHMLSTGMNGASIFDGQEWQVLFNKSAFKNP